MDYERFLRTPTFDADGNIEDDVYCKRCAYNLRGLQEDRACPECGVSVALSTQGDLLYSADPKWVAKLSWGLKIILMMIAVRIISVLLFLWYRQPSFLMILTVEQFINIYGAWLLTAPEPKLIGEDRNISARRIVRLGLIAGIIGSFPQFVSLHSVLSEPALIVVSYCVIGLLFVRLAGEFALFIYYEQLAYRIPHGALAERVCFLRWAFFSALLVVILVGFARLFKPTPGRSSGQDVFGCIGMIAGLCIIIFGIMVLIMIMRLSRELTTEAKRSREYWATHAKLPVR